MKKIVRKSTAPPTRAPTKPASPFGDEEDEDSVDEPAAAEEYGSDEEYEHEEIRGGWGASQETIDSTSNYAQTFRPNKDTQIIRFLEPKPYAAFRRHWIDRPGVGKRAYTCLRSVGRECPLCDVGDKPGAVTAFNVALLADDGEPSLKSWECAVKLTGVVKTYSNDPKIGPLTRPGLYFAVQKSDTQQRQQSQTNVNPVRGRDLKEDYDLEPLTDAQVAKLLDRAYTADIVEVPPIATMEAVAAEFAGGEGETEEKGWGS